jgi:hypothetical protein
MLHLFLRLLAKVASFLNFGSELLDARHNPPLLVEWGEGDFDFQKHLWPNSILPARTSRFFVALFPAIACLCEPVKPPRIEFLRSWAEHREFPRRIATCHFALDYRHTAMPCPNLVYDDFPWL